MPPSATNDGDASPPPSYENDTPKELPPDLSLRLANLKFDQPTILPIPETCIAHLKFLECIYQLRQEIAQIPGLFGIAEPDPQNFADEQRLAEAKAKVSEKKWAVYVTRAVGRFERWWDLAIPPTSKGKPISRLRCGTVVLDAAEGREQSIDAWVPLKFSAGNIPPLGMSLLLLLLC